MQIVASVYARTIRTYVGGAYNAADHSIEDAVKAQYVAGSLIAHVVEEGGLFYFLNDDQTKKYGRGERVAPALKMRNRATIAARRQFGRDVIVA